MTNLQFTDSSNSLLHDEAISRAEVVTAIMRALGLLPDETASEAIFSDLAYEHPAFGYITRASRA